MSPVICHLLYITCHLSFPRGVDEQLSHIQSATYGVVQRGQDLLTVFETSGISLMADSQYNGETRVQVLLEYLQVSQGQVVRWSGGQV